eukprot:scaffold447_cov307-Pinguiococcus_pyrenoidosus.AAC.2
MQSDAVVTLFGARRLLVAVRFVQRGARSPESAPSETAAGRPWRALECGVEHDTSLAAGRNQRERRTRVRKPLQGPKRFRDRPFKQADLRGFVSHFSFVRVFLLWLLSGSPFFIKAVDAAYAAQGEKRSPNSAWLSPQPKRKHARTETGEELPMLVTAEADLVSHLSRLCKDQSAWIIVCGTIQRLSSDPAIQRSKGRTPRYEEWRQRGTSRMRIPSSPGVHKFQAKASWRSGWPRRLLGVPSRPPPRYWPGGSPEGERGVQADPSDEDFALRPLRPEDIAVW